jgi:hypothetical protein
MQIERVEENVQEMKNCSARDPKKLRCDRLFPSPTENGHEAIEIARQAIILSNAGRPTPCKTANDAAACSI